MSEIELICPGCGARYGLPADAIPPSGREVECSDCGHVWHARPKAATRLDLAGFQRAPGGDPDDNPNGAPAGPDPAVAPPPPSARLSADMMDLLKEEVERERLLREAEGTAPSDPTPEWAAEAPETPCPDKEAPTDEIDWPATTVILPAGSSRAMTPVAQPPVIAPSPAPPRLAPAPSGAPDPLDLPLPPRSDAGPRRTGPAVIRHSPPAPEIQGQPQTGPRAETTRPETTESRAGGRPGRNPGRGAGIAVSLLVAGAILGAYLAAPLLAERGGALAEPALALRGALDGVRLWLAETLGALRG